jgi:hypothetical protein
MMFDNNQCLIRITDQSVSFYPTVSFAHDNIRVMLAVVPVCFLFGQELLCAIHAPESA